MIRLFERLFESEPEDDFDNDEHMRELEEACKLRKKLRKEVYDHHTSDNMLEMLVPESLWSDDPLIRAHRLATGKYDRYIGGIARFDAYKESCKLLLKKFNII